MKIRFSGLGGQGVWERGEGLRMGHLKWPPCVFCLRKCFLFSFFLEFLSNICRCQHLFSGSTKDVSSIVGAPWRCGVLTTWSGKAGIGLGHLLGREHAATPQSGVEAPRLLKRSLSTLYFCCCCCFLLLSLLLCCCVVVLFCCCVVLLCC